MNKEAIHQVRDFSRFYTNIIGLLNNHILHSAYSLPEARVLYELYHLQPCNASQIMDTIKMDKGYLSRILKSFEKKALLTKKRNVEDGRSSRLVLTTRGNREFIRINHASDKQIAALLRQLSRSETKQVIRHMNSLKKILRKTLHHD